MAKTRVPYPFVEGLDTIPREQLFRNFSALEQGGDCWTADYSTACGIFAGENDVSSTPTALTAFGWGALRANTVGNGNTGIGAGALEANTTGGQNTGVGTGALNDNMLGNRNTGVGYNTMSRNVTGNDNVAVGRFALDSNEGGSWNVAIGSGALADNINGIDNIAVGFEVLARNTGSTNVAIGGLTGNTTGEENTGVGFLSLDTINPANATTTGSRQTALGKYTGQASPTQRNDFVCVGYGALVDGDNAVAIGSGASALAAGAIAIGKDSAGTSAVSNTQDLAVIGTSLTSLQVGGGISTGGSLQTGDPGGGAGAWTLGKFTAGAVSVDPANYLEVKVDGTVRKVLVANPSFVAGAVFGTAEVNFGATPTDEASIVITGLAGITATSHILCWIQSDDTTADNDADAHDTLSYYAQLTATTRVPGVGFTAVARLLGGVASGKYKLHYTAI